MGITTSINNFLDLILGWVFFLGSPWSVIILSFFITLLITLIYKITTDQVKMKEIRDKQKQYQKEIKDLKHDPAKMMEKQKEMMSLTGQYFRGSMKSMFYTFIPIILIFSWMGSHYGPEKILNLGIIKLGWLWTYIISSIIFSSIIRKVLKVH